jgi:hypothetical protein
MFYTITRTFAYTARRTTAQIADKEPGYGTKLPVTMNRMIWPRHGLTRGCNQESAEPTARPKPKG